MRLGILNPNTSVDTTRRMVSVANLTAGPDVDIVGITAPRGARYIQTPDQLEEAAAVVAALAPDLDEFGLDAVIVAAFGDPGRSRLGAALRIPVVGLAEASLGYAASLESHFAIVTTTPLLDRQLSEVCGDHARGLCRGIVYATGEAMSLLDDPNSLAELLLARCVEARRRWGVTNFVVGGGPLAEAATRMTSAPEFTVIDPVGAAVALAVQRCR